MMSLLMFMGYSIVTRATQYLDNTDSSILYSNENSERAWAHSTLGSANSTGTWESGLTYAFNNTISVNFCRTEDGCKIQVVFTGTGITLYVIQIADYGNFTIALDGGEAVVTTLPYRTDAWYNCTLYDIQSLPYGNHYVTVNMQSWTGDGSSVGSLIFDYAAVNADTIATTVTPSASLPVESISSVPIVTSSSAPRHSHIAIGAISGGVIGSLILIVAIVATLFFLRRKHISASKPVQLEPLLTFGIHNSTLGRTGDSSLKSLLQHSAESTPLMMTGAEATDIPLRGPLTRPLSEQSTTSQLQAAIMSAVRSSPTSQLAIEPNVSSTPAQTSFRSGSNFSDSQLTDEQVDFVRSLWNANVAAADIARVIERMKSRVSDEDVGSRAIGLTNSAGSPPSYDSLHH